MATEAQQALEGRRAIQSGSAGARNAEGTQQAKRRAIRRSGIQANRVADAPTQDSRWESGNPMGITGIENGYGGMGYGPTSPDVDKAMRRANPAAMTREVIDTVSRPKTVRAEGSIWDDPNYAAMANEQGAEYAIRARNLDRQVGMAQRGTEIRNQAMRGQLDRDAMKLEDQAMQQAMRPYTPEGTTAGFESVTGTETPRTSSLAVDETGAFTGEGKQAAMGPGPASDDEVVAQERQHEIRKESLSSIGSLIEGLSGINQYDLPKEQQKLLNQKIQALSDEYNHLVSMESDGANSTRGRRLSVEYGGRTYRIGDKFPDGRVLTKIYDNDDVEVQDQRDSVRGAAREGTPR